MERICGLVLSLLGLVACTDAVSDSPLGSQRAAIVYGDDNRRDVYAYSDPAWRERVRSSAVALIEPRFLQRPPSGRVTVTAEPLRSAYGLCEGERFLDQPAAADCSGTLIDHDLVLTAGHCFREDQNCDAYAYVFDFFYADADRLETLTSGDVYGCRGIVARGVSRDRDAEQLDYAIVQLDRSALAPRKPAVLSSRPLGPGVPVIAVGFTSGLPAKVDDGAHVIEPRKSTLDFFNLDSDTFQGSSGSGIYDWQGGLVGLLVRGGEDYVEVEDAGCSVSVRVPGGESGSPWEQATYVKRAVDALCDEGWPSPVLCNRAPRCGDGFCTMDEVGGSCPEDCAAAACNRPPCTKNLEPDPVPGAPGPGPGLVDAGAPADGAGPAAPGSNGRGCSAAPGRGDPAGWLWWVPFVFARALTFRQRKRR